MIIDFCVHTLFCLMLETLFLIVKSSVGVSCSSWNTVYICSEDSNDTQVEIALNAGLLATQQCHLVDMHLMKLTRNNDIYILQMK